MQSTDLRIRRESITGALNELRQEVVANRVGQHYIFLYSNIYFAAHASVKTETSNQRIVLVCEPFSRRAHKLRHQCCRNCIHGLLVEQTRRFRNDDVAELIAVSANSFSPLALYTRYLFSIEFRRETRC